MILSHYNDNAKKANVIIIWFLFETFTKNRKGTCDLSLFPVTMIA